MFLRALTSAVTLFDPQNLDANDFFQNEAFFAANHRPAIQNFMVRLIIRWDCIDLDSLYLLRLHIFFRLVLTSGGGAAILIVFDTDLVEYSK